MSLGVQGGAVCRGVAGSTSLKVDDFIVFQSLAGERMNHVLEYEKDVNEKETCILQKLNILPNKTIFIMFLSPGTRSRHLALMETIIQQPLKAHCIKYPQSFKGEYFL